MCEKQIENKWSWKEEISNSIHSNRSKWRNLLLLTKVLVLLSFSTYYLIYRALKQEYSIDDIEKLILLTDSSDILDKHRAVIGLKKLTYNITDQLIEYF